METKGGCYEVGIEYRWNHSDPDRGCLDFTGDQPAAWEFHVRADPVCLPRDYPGGYRRWSASL